MAEVLVEIVVTAGPLIAKRFQFDRPDTFLCGRANDAHVCLRDDGAISRQHFMLEIAPPHCRLTDLDSRNGTYVNGVRYGGTDAPRAGERVATGGAKTVMLKTGDEIAAGATKMKVHVTSAAAPVLTARGTHCPLCRAELSPGTAGEEGGDYLCHACADQMRLHPFQKVRRMVVSMLESMSGRAHLDLPGFDVTDELGAGGMARVYRAVNRRTQQVVAIKVILPEMASHPTGYKLFRREIEVTRQLKHPCIVDLMHPVIGGGACLFIMEFVDGTDLHALMNAQGGALPLATAAPIFLDVLDGLAHAHRAHIEVAMPDGRKYSAEGIVHRDLKPTNVLVYRAGDRYRAKVADFGLAKAFTTAGFSDMTSPGTAHGTPAYWPREQLLYFRYLNPPSDVFSAAAVFYQALTGCFVRNGVTELVSACRAQGRNPSIPDFVRLITSEPIVPVSVRDPGVPKHVAKVLDRALAEPPLSGTEETFRESLGRARYADAAEFREALLAALTADGIRV